ncbi:hypothetical protein DL96DRAFT_1779905 [Flagelloscypha sp. PMI_526]|nr:hypothetical protein DL96DRAFT_1779905 [Flagelloscypha sp. PMI_526]
MIPNYKIFDKKSPALHSIKNKEQGISKSFGQLQRVRKREGEVGGGGGVYRSQEQEATATETSSWTDFGSFDGTFANLRKCDLQFHMHVTSPTNPYPVLPHLRLLRHHPTVLPLVHFDLLVVHTPRGHRGTSEDWNRCLLPSTLSFDAATGKPLSFNGRISSTTTTDEENHDEENGQLARRKLLFWRSGNRLFPMLKPLKPALRRIPLKLFSVDGRMDKYEKEDDKDEENENKRGTAIRHSSVSGGGEIIRSFHVEISLSFRWLDGTWT